MSETSEDGATGALDRVQVYRLATELSDVAWDDALELKKEPLLFAHATQLLRAVGSIAANIAEGYGRRSAAERVRFYEYALTSGEEARAWYRVSSRAMAPDRLADRTRRLVSIRRLLLTMIRNERAKNWPRTKAP